MKQVVSILLVVALGVFVFLALYTGDHSPLQFTPYGEADLSTRVSQRFVDKTVTLGMGEAETAPDAQAEADAPAFEAMPALVVYGETRDAETGSANMVTSIVVNYRSFDTLGEVTVLFIAAFGVGLLLSGKRKRQQPAYEPSFILKHGARIVFGIMVVFGVYVFIHGHLTPGGGFPGGSIIAAAILLLYIADNEFQAKVKTFKILEGVAGSLYVIAGLLGLVIGGYFLQNFLPTGVVGDLVSAGVIPIVYILIGLKVGSELTGVIAGFATEEEAE
ncbi:MAG TPA: Na(+)/H(+) antiporter subunit B [Candidatus Limiplasma sp.]|nr:Na(+)/H(+) antiporter subunit B [Candidatus Limiplasma sp.]